MILSRPGRSGGDEPGFETIRGCVHKQRTLNTWLPSGTSAETFAVSAGPYINYRVEAGTKNEPVTYFVPIQKKGWKIDPHVSNLRSREFLLGFRSTLNVYKITAMGFLLVFREHVPGTLENRRCSVCSCSFSLFP